MDTVKIENIETEAVIGVYEFEWAAPQPLIIDLELAADFDRAFASDALSDTLDYDAINQAVKLFCATTQYQLLEALAGGIIRHLMDRFPIDQVGLKIRKPKALSNALATIWCQRTREQMDNLQLVNKACRDI